MTDVASVFSPGAGPAARRSKPGHEVIYRHTRAVRITHWINVVCITILLMSGLQILNAHPMLYWGAYGADADPAILGLMARHGADGKWHGVTQIGPLYFDTTGFLGLSGGERRGFPGWLTWPSHRNLALGRNWHFFMAWLFVLNGLTYLVVGAINGHLKRDLAPTRDQLEPRHIWRDIVDHVKLRHPTGEAAKSYNVLQKLAYLAVIGVLLPMMLLTGLTMSPGVDSVFPLLVSLMGGRQTARTLHFFTADLIVLFVIVHLVEVVIAGAANEIGSMITGRYAVKTGEAA